IGPDRIDDGDRPSAHRGNVGDVDHGAAPARKPRIAGDEFVHETFDGEQQIAVAVRYRGAVVADRDRVVTRQTERLSHRRDVALGGDTAGVAEPLGEGGYGERA